MITTVLSKKTGKKDKFITQQYETGLYVALYRQGESIPEQFGDTRPEEKFHKELREAIDKEKGTLIIEESTVL